MPKDPITPCWCSSLLLRRDILPRITVRIR
uniref:Uncharacterized protein n=1 Tax=Arundo donax TaxID=35708 RepID=A0A0A9FPX3_ARUDO